MNIILDFDGTVVTHGFPELGKEIGADIVLKELSNIGHKFILFTMRCDHPAEFELVVEEGIIPQKGEFLTQAVSWFKKNNIPLYGIQTNPTQHSWTTSPKAFGHLIIDDVALGAPLVLIPEISSRPFINWLEIAKYFYVREQFTFKQFERITDEYNLFFKKEYKIKDVYTFKHF